MYYGRDNFICVGVYCLYVMEETTRESFPEDGTKAEQIKWFDAHGDIEGATAIAFCVDASPSYARKVLNE